MLHSPDPGFLLFRGNLYKYTKKTILKKVGTCVTKLWQSPVLSLDSLLISLTWCNLKGDKPETAIQNCSASDKLA